MNPVEYILSESDRQSATHREYKGMMDAYVYLRFWGRNVLTVACVETVGGFINGDFSGWRRVPVVFNQGPPAPHPDVVPGVMASWIAAVDDRMVSADVEFMIRQFLEIHPFSDGNGRVASLLRNWMKHSLDNPQPLPYYFGEN